MGAAVGGMGSMFTFSHNHCGPRLRGDVVDYYPLDEGQVKLVADYTNHVDEIMMQTVGDALSKLAPAQLAMGDGLCTFAVNRRDNVKAQVVQLRAEGKPLKGVVEPRGSRSGGVRGAGPAPSHTLWLCLPPHDPEFHAMVRRLPGIRPDRPGKEPSGRRVRQYLWRGPEPAPAQGGRALQAVRRYARRLRSKGSGTAAETGLVRPAGDGLRFREPGLREGDDTRGSGEERASSGTIHPRWAKRMLEKLAAGETFSSSYPYPVQAWRLGGDLLLIGMGGEAVVNYSLRFKKNSGRTRGRAATPTTWWPTSPRSASGGRAATKAALIWTSTATQPCAGRAPWKSESRRRSTGSFRGTSVRWGIEPCRRPGNVQQFRWRGKGKPQHVALFNVPSSIAAFRSSHAQMGALRMAVVVFREVEYLVSYPDT